MNIKSEVTEMEYILSKTEKDLDGNFKAWVVKTDRAYRSKKIAAIVLLGKYMKEQVYDDLTYNFVRAIPVEKPLVWFEKPVLASSKKLALEFDRAIRLADDWLKKETPYL